MASSIWTVHLHTVASFLPVSQIFPNSMFFRIFSDQLQFRSALRTDANRNRRFSRRELAVNAVDPDRNSDDVVIRKLKKEDDQKPNQLQESIGSLPVFVFSSGKQLSRANIAIGLCIVVTMFAIVVRGFLTRKKTSSRPGSVADLVRRGQLRSDRRGISTPLKYEDPFNNPMVKVDKSNSTVEMCGKVYRLAPVILTGEIQTIHQRRRSRAYQWKRPTMFLKEGESVPPGVDPDTVRWIPANHPFATTTSDIDEELVQNNVHQKHGVPSRIQAEHEALQRNLEALQNDQKLRDPAAAGDFERPHMKSDEHSSSNAKLDFPSEDINNQFGSNPLSEETKNP